MSDLELKEKVCPECGSGLWYNNINNASGCDNLSCDYAPELIEAPEEDRYLKKLTEVEKELCLGIHRAMSEMQAVGGAHEAWQAVQDFISTVPADLPIGAYAPLLFTVRFLHALLATSTGEFPEEVKLLEQVSIWFANQHGLIKEVDG